MSGDSDLEPTCANLSAELVDFADANYAALGYRSRSALINEALAEKVEEIREAEAHV